jgi:hypothetical protein
VVEEEWNSAATSSNPIDVLEGLKSMHNGLHAWDQRVLCQPKKRLRAAQRDLEHVMRGPMSQENEQMKNDLAILIEKLLEQEEIGCTQRSRANWLQNCDKNTSFFS